MLLDGITQLADQVGKANMAIARSFASFLWRGNKGCCSTSPDLGSCQPTQKCSSSALWARDKGEALGYHTGARRLVRFENSLSHFLDLGLCFGQNGNRG